MGYLSDGYIDFSLILHLTTQHFTFLCVYWASGQNTNLIGAPSITVFQ